jgi:hypothetical protein
MAGVLERGFHWMLCVTKLGKQQATWTNGSVNIRAFCSFIQHFLSIFVGNVITRVLRSESIWGKLPGIIWWK